MNKANPPIPLDLDAMKNLDLTVIEKVLLAVITAENGRAGGASALAERIGVSDPCVRRALHRMRKFNLIEVAHNLGGKAVYVSRFTFPQRK